MAATTPRIISLLPSATEIVCAIGLGDALVGISHECDWPPCVRTLPVLTSAAIPAGLPSGETDRLVRERLARGEGLYALDDAVLRALQPTLIVTQALCEVCSIALPDVLRAARTLPMHPVVLSLEPGGIADIFSDIGRVAAAAEVSERATSVVSGLRTRLDVVRRAVAGRERPRVALLEWLDPPFVAGHWGPEMIASAGGADMLGSVGEKSAHIHWEQLREAAPEMIVVAPCGYDANRARADLAAAPLPSWWGDLPAVRTGCVFVMDGNAYISRPGPRVVDGTEILARLLHPDAFADGDEVRHRHAAYEAAFRR
ncbi:MAG: cobalamin-binding protein [Chloroflexota bacterium]|nr:cobalamin-binding protein [Chloroflexota bacterium]